jgi:hypothetical protein
MRWPLQVAAHEFGDFRMLRKILHPLMALMLAAGMASATLHDAQAGRGGRVAAGVAAGLIGLGILGAAAHGRGYDYDDYDDGCYRGRVRCHWEGGRCYENRYGEEVCRGGERVCHRPLVCD